MIRKIGAAAFAVLFFAAFLFAQFGDTLLTAEGKATVYDNQIKALGEIITAIESEPEEENKKASCSKSLPTEYSNVLGYSGYYVDEIWDDVWTSRVYYSGSVEGENKIIAQSYGFGIRDYQIDIDGDGKKELLCNCTAGGDSHTELYIFRRNGEKIEIGFVNWLKYDFEDLFYWGCNAVSTEYDSVCCDVIIKYCKADVSDETGIIHVDFGVVDYQEWDGGDFPFIDQEEAYEKYKSR